jgi:hypothetical protein
MMKKTGIVSCMLFLLFILAAAVNADTKFISHCAFVPDVDEANLGRTEWYLHEDSGRWYYAPLDLPQGSVIDGIFLFCKDSSATGSLDFYIIRNNPDTGLSVHQFPISTSDAIGIQHPSSWRVTAGTRTINHDVFTYTLTVKFNGNDPNLRVYGVRVHYH